MNEKGGGKGKGEGGGEAEDVTPPPMPVLADTGGLVGTDENLDPTQPGFVHLATLAMTIPGAPIVPAATEAVPVPRIFTPSGMRKVPANGHKPWVSPGKEKALAPADALSAQGYDALEHAGEAVRTLTKELVDGVVIAEVDDGG